MAEIINKMFPLVWKALDKEANTYEVLISSESEDRDKDIVLAIGARLDNYLKNPVVLYAHNYYDLPVGKALSVEPVQGVGLKAVMQFPKVGISPKADEVHGLWDEGFLNAASIGFIPKVSTMRDENDNPNWPLHGRIISDWESLEFSIVPVPANAAALRLSIEGTVEKRGRVLSASNEQRLRGAANMILEVLDQVATPPTEDEPIEDALNESDVKGLADVLAELNVVYKG